MMSVMKTLILLMLSLTTLSWMNCALPLQFAIAMTSSGPLMALATTFLTPNMECHSLLCKGSCHLHMLMASCSLEPGKMASHCLQLGNCFNKCFLCKMILTCPIRRLVSITTRNNTINEDPNFTAMLVAFGQFLDHDLDHIPISSKLEC